MVKKGKQHRRYCPTYPLKKGGRQSGQVRATTAVKVFSNSHGHTASFGLYQHSMDAEAQIVAFWNAVKAMEKEKGV